MGPAIDRLARRLRRLVRLSVALQELAVDVSMELAIIRRTLAADASGRLEAVVECALLRAAHARRQGEIRAAVAGAGKLELRWQRTGAALVRIDEGQWFRLARGDARLLSVLTGGAEEPDGFPAWQSYKQLAEHLRRQNGVSPTRGAIKESVHRIRRALKAADLNPFLLQVDRRQGGLRFLLRAASRFSSSSDTSSSFVADS